MSTSMFWIQMLVLFGSSRNHACRSYCTSSHVHVIAERAGRQQQASRPDSLTGCTMLYSRQEPIARSLARGRADQTCHQGEGGEGVKGGTALVLVSPRARHTSQVDATFFSLFHPSNSGRDHRLVPDACMQVIISRVSSELLVDRPALSAPNYSSASV